MNFLKSDVILLPYPFSDLSTTKVRPAVVISSDKGKYSDIFVVPITSKLKNLTAGEFLIKNWKESGLNVPSAIKRGCVLIDTNVILHKVGTLSENDMSLLNQSLKMWFEID